MTVAEDSAAISRARAMTRCRVGTAPGGTSLAKKTDISDAIKQVALTDGVRTIDSVGEDGDRVATRREGCQM